MHLLDLETSRQGSLKNNIFLREITERERERERESVGFGLFGYVRNNPSWRVFH